MQAYTIENDVLTGLAGAVDASATSITLREPVAPFRAPPEPLSAGQPGILTIVDRLTAPSAIEIVTYGARVVNGDGSVTLNSVVRGRQGTTARAWAASAQAYQAPTRDQLQQSVIGAAIGSAADAAAVRSLIGAGVGTVTSVSATAPVTSTGGATPTIAMPAATSIADGHMTAVQAAKLATIETGATANATNAQLRDRGTHTGTQTASTISDFIAEVRAQVLAALAAGTNVTLGVTGSGASTVITINSSGGGGSGSPGSPDQSIQFNNAGAFAGSSLLTWRSDVDRVQVPGVVGSQSLELSAQDEEDGTAAVAQSLHNVSVGGVGLWQLLLRDRTGVGLRRFRVQSGAAAPQFGIDSDWFDVYHAGNLPAVRRRPISVGWDAGRVNGVDQGLTVGLRIEARAEYGFDVAAWTLLPKAGSTGNITVEIRKRPFASGSFTAITDGAPPSISSGARGTASVTTWTTVNDGDLIEFEITALTGFVSGIVLQLRATQV